MQFPVRLHNAVLCNVQQYWKLKFEIFFEQFCIFQANSIIFFPFLSFHPKVDQ